MARRRFHDLRSLHTPATVTAVARIRYKTSWRPHAWEYGHTSIPIANASPRPTRIHVVIQARPPTGPPPTPTPGRGETGTVGTPRPSVGSASGNFERSLSTSRIS